MDPAERALLQRAEDWREQRSLEDLTPDAVQRITREQGIDFATALLFDRFQKSSKHSPFIQRIDSLRAVDSVPARSLDATLVIVPGALYLERPDLGSDGKLVREIAESFGLKTDLIPLKSFGSVTDNARIIREWLAMRGEEKIVLVSLSKGGADLKLALSAADSPTLFRNAIAWINVCGPLNGSSFANWILRSRIRTWFMRWKFRRQQRDFQFVTELQHGNGATLDVPIHPPGSMRIISVMGFPLQRHMTSRFSRFCHRVLSARGPNDGTTSLTDLANWPGEIYPVWGADHYFRSGELVRSLIAALLRFLGGDPQIAPIIAEEKNLRQSA